MKKPFLGLGLGVLSLVLFSFWLFQGCAGNFPSSVITPSLGVDVVSNFYEGSLLVNPALVNGTGGYFTDETYGGSTGHNNEINGSTNPIILLPRPDTGNYAIHLYGIEYDNPAATTNPAMELFCFLRNDSTSTNPYIYDLTGLTGVKFDYLIPPDDASTDSFFEIGITLDTPPTTNPAGTCPPVFGSNCYNYFSVNVSKPATIWSTQTVPFSTMKIRFTPGGANPVGLTSANALTGSKVVNGQTVTFESQALFLLWSFNNGGGGAPPAEEYIDYWIDNVRFY